MMRNLYLLAALFFISCNHPDSTIYTRFKETSKPETRNISTNEYKVIGVKDGDTFVILMDGKEQVLRLAHIDCPEKKQPFGTKAKQFASELCFGKNVKLKHNNKYDRNKRLIAEVILNNGININKELVRNGLAWHFKRYSDSQEYAELEISARKQQIGIWSEANPIAPREWRKKKR